jgi:predicted nucleic acid-binding protein
LIFEEATTEALDRLLLQDDQQATWWGTWTECAVTVSRLRREGRLDEVSEERVRARLDRLAGEWVEIEPLNDLRLLAMLVSKYHPLKAADSLQLAAALRWCEEDTDGSGFVCLDGRLRRAATDEGFDVLPKEVA